MAVRPLPAGSPTPDHIGLLSRIRSSDSDALDEAMRLHSAALLRYAIGLDAEPDAAEDAVQEAFVGLWERRTKWRSSESLRGLLFRMVRNRLLNRHRSRRVRDRWLDRMGRRPMRAPPTPLELTEENELADAVKEALSQLPERRREAFVLVRTAGLSYREAAQVMGISPQTFANHMSAALSALRDALRPYVEAANPDHLSFPHGRRTG